MFPLRCLKAITSGNETHLSCSGLIAESKVGFICYKAAFGDEELHISGYRGFILLKLLVSLNSTEIIIQLHFMRLQKW